MMDVAEFTVKEVAGVEPNRTALALVKFVPVMATLVPPAVVPLLVPSDQGLWSQVRGGLAFSLRGLSISASWLIVGLLFVLPWLVVLYAALWLARRLWRADRQPDRRRLASHPALAAGGRLGRLLRRQTGPKPCPAYPCRDSR